MTERDMLVRSFDDIVDPQTEAMIEGVYEYWHGKTLQDVVKEMPEPQYIDVGEGRTAQLIEVAPSGNDHDLNRDVALGLPYLNGYTPHMYIRAKTLQLLTNPNASVWMMPNNGAKAEAYSLTPEHKQRLASGDYRPIGEIYLKAFENVSTRIGNLAITGYSQGGLTALAMAAVGSDRLIIDKINADETPSAIGRSTKELSKAFTASGGWKDLKGAVADARIDALREAMSTPRLSLDLARFGIASVSTEGRILKRAMAGSAQELVESAIENGVHVKLGSVAASALFEIESIESSSSLLTTVQYVGEPFNRRHTTGDNVIAHAVMASHGLQL